MKKNIKKKYRPLKIAQIAPLWFPVPPEKYGGTERIVSSLTEGLQKRGHNVTLFAPGDSKTKARLVSVSKKGLSERKIPWQDWWWNNFNYSRAFEKAGQFDLIHSHWTPMGMFFERLTKTPVLHTFHNLPKKEDQRWQVMENYKKDSKVVFISKSQEKNSPLAFKNSYMVYNGIETGRFKFNQKPENHFVWIGRISKEKGIENAIALAEKAKITLLLAGQLQPMNKEYFLAKVKPRLSARIKYLGELSQKQLSSFYGRALAFLYPLEWQEPFGLCVAESLACGTPVITLDRGSMKELVSDGKTGFVLKNMNQMAQAIKKIGMIKRENCRKQVEEKFDSEIMVENYEKIYQQICGN